ncbi:MAG TPA: hypothetical protein VGK30_18140 [Candidatus Binatia bacterium]|jgi:hypothetical protein
MTTITNKTRRPVRVPLPGGKTLHLGPGKSGQISSKDAEDVRVKKLVEEATIEIVDGDTPHASAGGDGNKGPRGGGHLPRSAGARRSGDR